VIGFTGLIEFLLRFIRPLTIAPTITLVGVALFHVVAEHAGNLINRAAMGRARFMFYPWFIFFNFFFVGDQT